MIEAVVENEQVKTEIFQVLDQVVTRPDAILASNTSSIPLVKLAVATSGPTRSSASTSSTRPRCSSWSS